jgi:Tfp pilus assembly protein PilF
MKTTSMPKTALTIAITLAATTGLLGSQPALSWSPLQYDTKGEFSSIDTPHGGAKPRTPDEQAGRHSNAEPDKSAKPNPAWIDAPQDIDGMNPGAPEKSETKPSQPAAAQPELPKPQASEQPKVKQQDQSLKSQNDDLDEAPGFGAGTKESAAAKETASEKETVSAKETAGTRDSADADSSTPSRKLKSSESKPKSRGIVPNELTLDPDYFLRRAQSFVRQKDYQSALNYINKAMELTPDNYGLWYEKALIYQLAGYDAAAARRYLSLIQHRPDMLEAHIGLGSLYSKHNNLELAAQEYHRAIEINFYSFPSHYNLANVYMGQDKLTDALKEYKVCLKLKPNNAMVHNNIGVVYQQRKFYEEAAEEFARATHLDPGNQVCRDNLANVRAILAKKPAHEVQM